MKSSSKTKIALRFYEEEVKELLLATLKIKARHWGRWWVCRAKIMKAYINSIRSSEKTTVLTFTKSELRDLTWGVDAVARKSGEKKWEFLHAKLFMALNRCETEEFEKIKQMLAEHDSKMDGERCENR